MGPDTIFPQLLNYGWSPRYLYNMVGINWLIQNVLVQTLLHQQGKMLNTEWGDKTQVSSLDILVLRKSRAVLTFGNLHHLCALLVKCPVSVQCSVNELRSFMGTSMQHIKDQDWSFAVSSAPIFSSHWSTCNTTRTFMRLRHTPKWT